MEATQQPPAETPASQPLSYDEIPVATESVQETIPVAGKRFSTTHMVILVFLIILALMAYRSRDYLRFDLIPRIERYIATQYDGASASPESKSTSQVSAFTKKSV